MFISNKPFPTKNVPQGGPQSDLMTSVLRNVEIMSQALSGGGMAGPLLSHSKDQVSLSGIADNAMMCADFMSAFAENFGGGGAEAKAEAGKK